MGIGLSIYETNIMPKNGPSSEFWVFTLNNYTPSHLDHLGTLHDRGTATYLVYGKEVGANGTPHLQGFVVWTTRRTLRSTKALLGTDTVHAEVMRGTPAEAATYCRKDGNVTEYGTCPEGTSSTPNRFRQAVDYARTGIGLATFLDNYPDVYVRYRSGMETLLAISARPRSFRSQLVWYQGDAGTGKSTRVRDDATLLAGGDTRDVYWLGDSSGRWWCGYLSQRIVVIDDLGPSCNFSIEAFLRLADQFPLRLQNKGGSIEFRGRIILVTSNRMPEDCFPSCDFTQKQALYRRMDEFHQLSWCSDKETKSVAISSSSPRSEFNLGRRW
jgi:hypothetical protein